MDKNVEILLTAEAEVNAKVTAALKKKEQMMQSIRREADIDLMSYKAAKKTEYENNLAAVRIPC